MKIKNKTYVVKLCIHQITYVHFQMNEMEALRIDEELQKQKYTPSHHHTFNRMSDQAAIGMVDLEMLTPGGDPGINRLSAPECSGLKKTALSNSLIDLTDGKNLRYFVQENRVRKCT